MGVLQGKGAGLGGRPATKVQRRVGFRKGWNWGCRKEVRRGGLKFEQVDG